MNAAEFHLVLERRIAKIQGTLAAKAEEYASDKDRLHNFKQALLFGATSPGQAAIDFMRKHLVSALDIVKSLEDNQTRPQHNEAYLDEKFGDIINYFILLEAIVREENGILMLEK